LHRSAYSYDAGFEDEALRIAVTLRVLFHDKPHSNSVSLLTHLDAKDVPLLSTCPDRGPDWVSLSGALSLLHIQVTADGARARHVPKLDREPLAHFRPRPDWWGQQIYLTEHGPVTREVLVRSAADKEAAHVDASLNPEYEAIVHGVWFLGDQDDGSAVSIPNSHLADLRQMAHEVLHSPELLALGGMTAADF
jgi:hypothetical protein